MNRPRKCGHFHSLWDACNTCDFQPDLPEEYLLRKLYWLAMQRFSKNGGEEDLPTVRHIIRFRALWGIDQGGPDDNDHILATQFFKQGFLELKFPRRGFKKLGYAWIF